MLLAAIGAARARPPEPTRTLVACAGAVWIWPGIPLTSQRGAEIVPASGETIRFWITRLHGPEALDKDILHAIAWAARCLTLSDELGAQRALDALQLMEISRDGAALMRAVADHLGIDSLRLPLRAGAAHVGGAGHCDPSATLQAVHRSSAAGEGRALGSVQTSSLAGGSTRQPGRTVRAGW